jgi:hypothetical protein
MALGSCDQDEPYLLNPIAALPYLSKCEDLQLRGIQTTSTLKDILTCCSLHLRSLYFDTADCWCNKGDVKSTSMRFPQLHTLQITYGDLLERSNSLQFIKWILPRASMLKSLIFYNSSWNEPLLPLKILQVVKSSNISRLNIFGDFSLLHSEWKDDMISSSLTELKLYHLADTSLPDNKLTYISSLHLKTLKIPRSFAVHTCPSLVNLEMTYCFFKNFFISCLPSLLLKCPKLRKLEVKFHSKSVPRWKSKRLELYEYLKNYPALQLKSYILSLQECKRLNLDRVFNIKKIDERTYPPSTCLMLTPKN